ncbi:MAG: MBL fold metallo-hydrolase [Nitrospiraceae bacterium]|nr:MBL fold metallo-hydrolase [Nitrospiraceae bacterium]
MSSPEIIDTHQFGLPGTGAAYHIYGEKHALIDTGTSHSVARIREQLGLHAPDFIFLTHIHPDHAGGASLLAQAYPQAIIGVHERGVKHLIDPSQVNASVHASTGELAGLYGEMFPMPPERITVLKHGDRFDLGKGMIIEVIDAPGHAPHHLCFFERSHRALFCGDAVGILRGRIRVPATVPPSFDLEESRATIRRLEKYKPNRLYLAHFGEVRNAVSVLEQYDHALCEWVKRIRKLRRDLSDEAVVQEILSAPQFKSLAEELRFELGMCVRGVLHYLARRHG